RAAKRVVTASPQRLHRIVPGVFQRADGPVGRGARLFAVAEPVDDADEDPGGERRDDGRIPRAALPGERPLRDGPVDHRCWSAGATAHFFILTVVPRSTTDSISNSSMRRLAPGSPSPRLRPVE